MQLGAEPSLRTQALSPRLLWAAISCVAACGRTERGCASTRSVEVVDASPAGPTLPARRPPDVHLTAATRIVGTAAKTAPPRPRALIVGEGWGCAEVVTEESVGWQCWQAAPAGGPNSD